MNVYERFFRYRKTMNALTSHKAEDSGRVFQNLLYTAETYLVRTPTCPQIEELRRWAVWNALVTLQPSYT